MSRTAVDWGSLRSARSVGELGEKTGWETDRLAGGLGCLAVEEASVAGTGGSGFLGLGTRSGYEGMTLLDCQQQGLPKHRRRPVWSTRRTVTTRCGDGGFAANSPALQWRVRHRSTPVTAGDALEGGARLTLKDLGWLGKGALCVLRARSYGNVLGMNGRMEVRACSLDRARGLQQPGRGASGWVLCGKSGRRDSRKKCGGWQGPKIASVGGWAAAGQQR